MVLYQGGDDRAFEVLYRRHSGRVFDFLQKRSSSQNASELLQEAFLKLHKARHQYSVQYPFLPWLFTITRNVLFDFSRLNETKVAKSMVTRELDLTAAPEPRPEFGIALHSLPEAQRRAIELRYLSDWSFEKIASDMRTTPLNARQLVSRGLKKLRAKVVGKSK